MHTSSPMLAGWDYPQMKAGAKADGEMWWEEDGEGPWDEGKPSCCDWWMFPTGSVKNTHKVLKKSIQHEGNTVRHWDVCWLDDRIYQLRVEVKRVNAPWTQTSPVIFLKRCTSGLSVISSVGAASIWPRSINQTSALAEDVAVSSPSHRVSADWLAAIRHTVMWCNSRSCEFTASWFRCDSLTAPEENKWY